MIHPLFRLIATRPQLLADHLEAYAQLVAEEAGQAAQRFKRGLMLQAVAAVSAGIAAALAGVGLMLWAVIPPADIQAPWALWVAPGLPLLIAAGCIVAARAGSGTSALASLSTQVRADMAMFREASGA